jgi:hypothetical protein
VSRLATVVGALSAIVTLIDFLAARSSLWHWVERQIKHGDDGWLISPTLNLLFIAGLVGFVWLLTDTSLNDPETRKRLFQIRTHLVLLALAAWFFCGPSIGDTGGDSASLPSSAQPDLVGRPHATPHGGQPTGVTVSRGAQPFPVGPTVSQGRTSQFTWNNTSRQPSRGRIWRPGDGLRAIGRFLEESSDPAHLPGG